MSAVKSKYVVTSPSGAAGMPAATGTKDWEPPNAEIC
jgi:hypothetical protein